MERSGSQRSGAQETAAWWHRVPRLSRAADLVGVPWPVAGLAVLMAVLLGILLSYSLQASTQTRQNLRSTTIGDGASIGKNSSGQSVVTETTLGPEVQRLVDSGAVAPMANFNAVTCVEEQGITDPVLIMEEVAWGPDQTPGWLLVHGPISRENLRASGGAVSATVVTDQCGADGAAPAARTRLWSGSVMIGGV